MRGCMQVLGTVKNALVVWMGIIFLAELVTPLQVSQCGKMATHSPTHQLCNCTHVMPLLLGMHRCGSPCPWIVLACSGSCY